MLSRSFSYFRFSSLNLTQLSDVVSMDSIMGNFQESQPISMLENFSYIVSNRDGKPISFSLKQPVFYDFSTKSVFGKETTAEQLSQQSFFVRSNEDQQLIAVLLDTPTFSRSSEISQNHVGSLALQLNLSSQNSMILSDYITRLSTQLLQTSYSEIDLQQLQLANKKVLTDLSLQSKRKVELYDTILSVLNKKLHKLEEHQREITIKTEKSSSKYLNRVFAVTLTKVFALQYATYILLSWDIMEPITCLFGIFDIALAYYFWLATHSEFDYFNLKARYIRKKFLSKENLSVLDELQETRALIEFILEQKQLESPHLSALLDI